MPEPEAGGGQSHGCQEVAGELVVAGGDATEVLELVEEALDEVALTVDGLVDGALDLAGPVRGDVGVSPEALDVGDDGFTVVATVTDNVAAGHGGVQQFRYRPYVVRLPSSQNQLVRQTASIHLDVDLGGQSSTRTANGVIRAPFFPPAACWWARTIEESIR